MAQLSETQAVERHNNAWSRKEHWRDIHEDAYDLALPNRETFTRNKPGAKKMDRVWDSTAINATQAFANGMLADLTPAFERWFELRAGPAVIDDNEKKQRNDILGAITAQVAAVFQTGAFSSAAHEMYQDLAVGTGGLLVMPGADGEFPVVFQAIPLAEFMVEEGPNGKIEAWHRKHEVKARNIKDTWEDAKIDHELAEMIEDKPDDVVKFFEIIYRDRDLKSPGRFRYEVFRDKQSGERLVERVMRRAPMVTPRWSKTPGEEMGRGPLITALPDIRTLNKMVELTLKQAALAMLGVYTVVDDDVVSTSAVKLAPGAMISVRSNGGTRGPSMAPLQTGRDFQLGQLVIETLQANIRRMLHDNALPPPAGPVRSATEIVERLRQFADENGAAFGRLMHEYVIPLIQRVLDILIEKGIVQTEIEIDQFFTEVSVTSPLARQQALADVQTVVQWLEIVAAIGGPQAMLVASKADEVMAWIPEQLGVPAKLVPTIDEMQDMQEKLANIVAAGQGDAVPGREGGGVPMREAA